MGAGCTGADTDADMVGFLDCFAQTDLDSSLNKECESREDSMIAWSESENVPWGPVVDQSTLLDWKSEVRDTGSHYCEIISTDGAIESMHIPCHAKGYRDSWSPLSRVIKEQREDTKLKH